MLYVKGNVHPVNIREDIRLDAKSSGRTRVSTDMKVQDFWLQNLNTANAFSRWVVDEISPWVGESVLEVGCGVGTYTLELARLGKSIVSIDMEVRFIEAAKHRLHEFANVEFLHGDATTMDLPTGHGGFDTVVLMDVLEHIERDVSLLERLRLRLKPNGCIIIKVPAMPSLYCAMDQAIGHWRRYDRKNLSRTISSAGFQVVEVRPFNAFGVPGWWWNGRVLKRRSPPADQIALFNRLTPLFRPLDKLARHFLSSSLIGIGRV
jgi:2-polyprenyl-3-methyl-5-hydroxy-6-metoxy-1,4-benzoquinol methylase